jgi:alpha-mannosidase
MFHHQRDGDDFVQLQVWSAPGRSKPTFEEAKRATYKPAKKGESFGPSWTNHWFKVTIHIPSEWAEYERVQLEFDSTGEAMVYSTDGFPLHGLTGGYGGDRRVEFIIPEAQRKAGVAHYFIEATCNKLGGQNDIHAPDDNQYYRLNSADLVVPNMEAWRLMWDFNTLKGLLDALPGDTPLAMRCQYVANEIMNIFVPTDPDSIKKARKAAETILGENWETMMEDDSQKAEKQQGTLWGIGHWYVVYYAFSPIHNVH